MTLPRGVREAALAALAALAVVLTQDLPGGALAWRKLEVASLDLRFQMRGPIPARPDVVLVMADDASLARLGRWPLSRHLLARAVDRLDAAGARVIVFDQLFTEPDQPKPPNLRAIAGAAAAALPSGAPADLRQALTALAEDDPDADFAASIRRSGKVLLPFALVSYYPTMAYVGKLGVDGHPGFPEVLLLGGTWMALLRLANIVLYHHATRRLEVQGG